MANGRIIGPQEVSPQEGYCGTVYELIGRHNSSVTRLDCVLVEMGPGTRSKPHKHTTGEELYFVVSGIAKVRLAKQEQNISNGYVVYIPPGVIHALHNIDVTPLRLFVVNAPPYDPEDVLFEVS